jgi:aminoglycoside 2'-N-acetyltransferase I
MPIRVARTDELSPDDLRAIRALMDAAFDGDFGDEDFEHALGGMHWLDEAPDGRLLAHACVVPRVLEIGGRPFRTGYVEAVGTEPASQGRGHGTAVMRPATRHIRASYELGALGTGEHRFYERLGWERWKGPSWVRLPDGALERSEEDDDGIMVLRFGPSAAVDRSAPISCEWRPGDSW